MCAWAVAEKLKYRTRIEATLFFCPTNLCEFINLISLIKMAKFE